MRCLALELLLALGTPGSTRPAPAHEVVMPPLTHALSLGDFEGMQPKAGLENRVTRVSGFVQRRPVDGSAVSQRTEAYLAHDAAHLYAVFVCFDADASRIRARWRNRDSVLNDDLVSLQLDTFRDQRRAYVFAVNPLGVQADAVWVEGEGFDATFDTVWDAETSLNAAGYLVWIRVPFRSLRFPRSEQQRWGILLNRDIPRNSEESFWPRYSTRIQGRLNQIGVLSGLAGVSPGHNMRLVPHTVGAAARTLDLERTGAPAQQSWTREAGLDAKLVVRDSFVLDATLNPDFSQVESDEPQITVNQRFERFFPEKRPFFLENGNYFSTPIPLVFRRRIVEPRFGLRVTGKHERWGVGGFLADDAAAPQAEDRGRAGVGALRVSRELASQSSLGLALTSRTQGGSSNHVGALDGRLRLGDTWVGSFQIVGSRTAEASGAAEIGHAAELLLRHESRHWVAESAYSDRSTDFRADLGFVPRVGIRQWRQKAAHVFRPENRVLLSWSPGLDLSLTDAPGGRWLDWEVKPSLTAELRRQAILSVNARAAGERLRPEDLPGLADEIEFRMQQLGASVETNTWAGLSLSAEVSIGEGVNLAPAAGAPPRLGDRREVVATMTLRPRRRLEIDNAYLHSTLRDGGRTVFVSHAARSKWNYQFTRALSLRSIVQLDLLRPSAELSSLRTDERINLDLLVTYLAQPGRALHLGFNSNWGMDTRPGERLRNDSRLLFAKVSYAFP